MKILQLCKKFPYPLRDGESIAVTYLSKALHSLGCEMSLLAMNTKKHFVDVSQLPPDFSHYKRIESTELDTSIKPLKAFANLFSRDSYHIARFVSPSFEAKLIEMLQQDDYDIVQMETLYLVPYMETVKKYSRAKVVLRAHNVEHEIWERITNNTSVRFKKWYLGHLTRKLKNFELEHLNDYDMLVAITDRDLCNFRRMGYKNGAMVSPIGIDTSYYHIPVDNSKSSSDLSMCFIGSLDWMPNLEGISWFLEDVWPELHRKMPELALHIAGRNTPESILSMDRSQVHIHGEVQDAITFINDHPVMIVPLFSGSGMRVKILEGMALGKCVITTQMGLEGIEAKHKEQVLIANSKDEFLEALDFCRRNPSAAKAIGDRAIKFVEERYDNKFIAQNLYDTYEKYLLKSLEKTPAS